MILLLGEQGEQITITPHSCCQNQIGGIEKKKQYYHDGMSVRDCANTKDIKQGYAFPILRHSAVERFVLQKQGFK